MTCAPIEDSDQPGHPPSLIRVFAVHSLGSLGLKVSTCGQRWLWPDRADAQADLSLRWMHRSFCWFFHAVAHMITFSIMCFSLTLEQRELCKARKKLVQYLYRLKTYEVIFTFSLHTPPETFIILLWLITPCHAHLYRKNPKYLDTQNICCNHPKI